ncbi:replication initiator protein A [Streptococcus cuniculipharyngis]|uniref:Replication initiator protein n=1 Tax=Streptococcus cuniculipharyngis TaxID=1562651 RepID=A0A5C5SCN5_9STRE|nr:replication initiator protein A [Streptococcus cuniculipharyngis]TWS98837.1 replication initiator protein [Streptococcus cuniculipharyngis]
MKRISANQYQTSERYYKLPKLLFESERYKDMKLEVKVAYAVLKDRLELSLSRGWIDEQGFIYLIYSNSKLLAIKKSLRDYGLIEEVQQSSSEKGRLANKIYLGELEHEPTPVLNSDGGGVQKTRGQSQKQTGPVLISAPSETEDNETEHSETKESDCLSEDEEEKGLTRKVDKPTTYDKDYIYQLVYDQLIREKFSKTSAEFVMRHFETRYQYALENMRFARTAEAIAEYVFNGILAEWNKERRQEQERR